ncbi:hypothetical protein FQN57_002838 [Myotisia sp. PD_48]|nr:hypothetical protein FQN57_002838 [Myotisia sp. PD_48]
MSVQFDLELQSPLIFDDSLDFSDPEESMFAGAYSDNLLAKSGGILSMPALDRPAKVEFTDPNESSNALNDPSTLLACPPGSYGTPIYAPMFDGNFVSDDDSIGYMPNNTYAGSPFQIARSPSLESHSRPLPEVLSFSPSLGGEGTKLSVYIQSLVDLLTPPTWAFSLIFGSLHCDCTIAPLGFEDSRYQYVLMVDVPAFATTCSGGPSVSLQVVINDQETSVPHIVRVGSFSYSEKAMETPQRKRRMSAASNDTSLSANSRSVKQLRMNENSTVVTAHSERLSASPYSPYLSTPASLCGYPTQYHQQVPATVQFDHIQARTNAPSPLASSWSPSVSDATVSSCSPSLSGTPLAKDPEQSGSGKPHNPTLVRTSTIQHSLAGAPCVQNQPFNPYAMYPTKAVLKLNGNLDTMTENWTVEERESQRRLVQFSRGQEGSTIHADFKPVAPADRVPNSICISCIYWAGKDECYVTSVDTIYLLESLVGVRFTVEEKNRIRRNLEGFRPSTVSKAKPDSEEFFKVIMGFPNPKPRNIEKDVKVFPWKILTHALKKIIGKYSASYSSTASALPTPLGSNYVSPRITSSCLDARSASPLSVPGCGITHVSNVGHPTHPAHTGAPLASNFHPMMVTSSAPHAALTATYGYPELNQRHIQPSPVIVPSHSSFDFNPYGGHNPMTVPYSTS